MTAPLQLDSHSLDLFFSSINLSPDTTVAALHVGPSLSLEMALLQCEKINISLAVPTFLLLRQRSSGTVCTDPRTDKPLYLHHHC